MPNIYHSILLKDESHFLLLICWNYNNSKTTLCDRLRRSRTAALSFDIIQIIFLLKEKKRLDFKCRSSRWHCTYKNFKEGTHLLWSNLQKQTLVQNIFVLSVDRYIKSACSLTYASRDFVHNYTKEILLETHRKRYNYKLMDTKKQQPRGLNFKQLYA